jgi:predicted phage tail protein
MTVTFSSDLTVVNNTAKYSTAETTADGKYTLELAPGSYNVSITELVNESGQNFTYTFTGQLSVISGQAPKTFNMILTKEEAP